MLRYPWIVFLLLQTFELRSLAALDDSKIGGRTAEVARRGIVARLISHQRVLKARAPPECGPIGRREIIERKHARIGTRTVGDDLPVSRDPGVVESELGAEPCAEPRNGLYLDGRIIGRPLELVGLHDFNADADGIHLRILESQPLGTAAGVIAVE